MKVKIGPFPKGNTERKIEVQIDVYDTWNCDHTLAHIIYPMLCQLRDTKKGVPNDFCNAGGEEYGVQDSFDFYKESHQQAFDDKCQEWDIVLDKMIWSFEQLIHDEYDGKYRHGEAKFDFEPIDKTFPDPVTGKTKQSMTLVDKNPDEHWTDYEGLGLHEERIQEGLDLFGRYFRALWD